MQRTSETKSPRAESLVSFISLARVRFASLFLLTRAAARSGPGLFACPLLLVIGFQEVPHDRPDRLPLVEGVVVEPLPQRGGDTTIYHPVLGQDAGTPRPDEVPSRQTAQTVGVTLDSGSETERVSHARVRAYPIVPDFLTPRRTLPGGCASPPRGPAA